MISALLLVGLGIWLILAPTNLGYADSTSGAFSALAGSLLAACATLAVSEVLSSFRWLCALIAIGILFSPGWLPETDPSSIVVNVITGLLGLSLSLLPRRRKHTYGGGWRALWKARDTALNKITWS